MITLEVTVDGQKAVAYACDGNAVEVWLRGTATNGALSLASKDGASRLTGRLVGDSIAGTLSIGAKSWDFTAAPVDPPAGLYVYEDDGVRSSWIVDSGAASPGFSVGRTARRSRRRCRAPMAWPNERREGHRDQGRG